MTKVEEMFEELIYIIDGRWALILAGKFNDEDKSEYQRVVEHNLGLKEYSFKQKLQYLFDNLKEGA